MNFLSIDIGTTGCKCQLFSEGGEILEYLFSEYPFLEAGGFHYVNIHAISDRLRSMITEVASRHEVSSLAISSLGESFVLLDDEDNVLFYPMLYTDARGEEEAQAINAAIGAERVFEISGVVAHSMYSISKLLYIKNHEPAVFAKAKKAMLMCDYFGYLLTGERVIDYSLAARTGAFDVEQLRFSREILDCLGIDAALFSEPKRTGSIVGRVRSGWGIDGATLVLGSHDQICAALGAGVLMAGEAADGMGTVECITTVFDEKPTAFQMGYQGYPCVPYAIEGLYCTYILNYSCGSTVNWFRKRIMHGYSGDEKDFFSYIEKNMSDEPSNLLVLPYFGGAATPYQDIMASGAILGLTTETADHEIYKAIMEGTAMEMRLNAEVTEDYGINISNLVATGGGANSKKWLQIKSNIQRLSIKVLRSNEGGLCGCAMLSALGMKQVKNLMEARDIFVKYTNEFLPNEAVSESYDAKYQKYKKLYKTIKELN